MHLPDILLGKIDRQAQRPARRYMTAYGLAAPIWCTEQSRVGETDLRDQELADVLLASFRQAEH